MADPIVAHVVNGPRTDTTVDTCIHTTAVDNEPHDALLVLLTGATGWVLFPHLIVDVYTIHVEVVGFDRFWLLNSAFLSTDLTFTGDQVTSTSCPSNLTRSCICHGWPGFPNTLDMTPPSIVLVSGCMALNAHWHLTTVSIPCLAHYYD